MNRIVAEIIALFTLRHSTFDIKVLSIVNLIVVVFRPTQEQLASKLLLTITGLLSSYEIDFIILSFQGS